MNKEHKEILQKNRTFFVENLTTDAIESICDVLLGNGTLTSGLADTILKKTPKPQGQTRELLTNLAKRGPKAYTSFIDALNQTGNEFIAEKLTACLPKAPPGEEINVHKTPIAAEWPDLKKVSSLSDGKDIQKTTEEIYAEILQKHNRDKIYSMTKKTKGKVIFLYNKCKPTEEDAQTKNCLESFDWDKTILESLFKCTGFEKKGDHSKSGEEMKIFLEKQMLPKENEGYDSLIVVICSAGVEYEPSKIYDINGKEVPLDSILYIIKSSPAFKGKPKVVILHTYSFKELKKPRDELDSTMEKLKLNKENAEDLFVVSSYPKPGYGPWMIGSNLKGSYFIQALVYVMKNHGHTMSFVEIMEEVNKCLSNAVVPEFEKEKETQKTTKKAVAEVLFVTKCLQRQFFIFPGLVLKNPETSSKGNPVCQSKS